MNRTLFGFTRKGSGRLRLVLPMFLRYGVGYEPARDTFTKGWWVRVLSIGGVGGVRTGEILL